MYIKNDICYANEQVDDIKVIKAKPLTGRMLLLTFNTGEMKLFDTHRLTGPAFQKLASEEVFCHPSVFHGAVTWDNGKIDVAPEMMYEDGVDYQDDAAYAVV